MKELAALVIIILLSFIKQSTVNNQSAVHS